MRLGGPVVGPFENPDAWAAALKELGYSAAYFPVDLDDGEEVVKGYAEAADRAGIVIAEVGAWSNPVARDDDERKKAVARCERQLALADLAGARCCVNIAGSRGETWDGPDADNLTPETFDLIVETVRGIIDAVKRPPRLMGGCGDDPIDFGHVGDIVKVNTEPVRLLCEAGYLPVLNSLGSDDQGRAYNINADIAATRVAHAMKADHLVLITGKVPGVLRDPDDLSTRIARLTASEARQAIVDGIIKGGMIPKIEESLEVLERGVGAIHIVGTLDGGDLPNVLLDPGCIGTVLVPDEG